MGLEEGGPRGGTTSLPGGGLAGSATAARALGFPWQDRPSGRGRVQDAALRVPGLCCSLPRTAIRRLQMAPRTTCSQEPVRWILAGGQLSRGRGRVKAPGGFPSQQTGQLG